MADAQSQAAVTPQYRQGRHLLWFAILGYSAVRLSQVWPRHEVVLIALYSSILWGPLTVILHELGHALTSLFVDSKVTRIKLGLTQNPTGPHLAFRFLGFPWELYALPVSGSVHHIPPQAREYFRTCSVLVTAAGPAVSLVLAIVSLLLFESILPEPWNAVAMGCFLSNFFVFVVTMCPIRLTYRGRPVNTDFSLIAKHLALTDEEIERKCYLSGLQADVDREKQVLQTLSPDEAVAYHESNPERLSTLLLLVDKLEKANDPRHNEYLAKLIERPRLDNKALADYLDLHLTRHLNEGTIASNTHFNRFSQKLLELSGDLITARGTRGSVLVDLGRIDEGKAMLLDVLAKTESPVDKTYANIFLALAEKQAGQLEVARDYAAAAAQLSPDSPALKRVADLLEPAERRS